MATTKNIRAPYPLQCSASEWREGKRRAIALLRDLENTSADDMDCKDDCREGRPQVNLVHAHLLAMTATQSDGVLAAFSSVLTHYMGNTARGGVPDVDRTSREMATPISMCWPQKSRVPVPMQPFSGVANGQA